MTARQAPCVVVSRCLLGERTRYDGARKTAPWVMATLKDVRIIGVCPEVEAGMPTPREPMSVTGSTLWPRLTGNDSGHDYTSQLASWGLKHLRRLRALNVCGFVLKARSPSCGLGFGVTPWLVRRPGLYAAMARETFPRAAFADEARLADAANRTEFLAALDRAAV